MAVSSDGNTATFEIEAQQRFVHFKPCLIKNGSLHWAVGPDNLLIMAGKDARPVCPYFFSDSRGRFSPIVQIESAILGRHHRLRIYLPPSYDENTRRHVTPSPTCRTDRTCSFPRKHFDTSIGKSTKRVRFCGQCGQSEDLVIVGVYSNERREEEYTKPGYGAYARSIVEELVPAEQLFLRTTNDPVDRSMWGSSLGGVVSFYSAWEYPGVFGGAVCMSSTFSYKDDLIERVLSEPARDVRFYLDSGWPNDNYEVTTEMALALVSRGWRYGCDFINLVFPHAAHDEKAWGMRLHLPMQFFTGAVARASRAMIS